jgi:hypothetical protein
MNKNPEASDALESITEWWIRKSIINMNINEVFDCNRTASPGEYLYGKEND